MSEDFILRYEWISSVKIDGKSRQGSVITAAMSRKVCCDARPTAKEIDVKTLTIASV